MKVFINWFINCNCCVWFFSRASSTPVSFSPLWRVSTVSRKRLILHHHVPSLCSFILYVHVLSLEVLARFLSSLHWLLLSLFLFRPNTAKDFSNCTSKLSLSSAFSVLLFADLTNAGKCLAWIIQGDWRSRCLCAPEQNLFRRRMARFSCLVTIMILCHFIPILEIFHLLLALGICHVLNFRYLFSHFFPHLPGMPHL